MLDTVTRNGGVSAQETLASRTIQALKEREALLIQEIALLAPNDPRRGPIQAGLTSMRAEIASETDKIIASIKRDTEVARSTVAALEHPWRKFSPRLRKLRQWRRQRLSS